MSETRGLTYVHMFTCAGRNGLLPPSWRKRVLYCRQEDRILLDPVRPLMIDSRMEKRAEGRVIEAVIASSGGARSRHPSEYCMDRSRGLAS
jgi:hypothetical protein